MVHDTAATPTGRARRPLPGPIPSLARSLTALAALAALVGVAAPASAQEPSPYVDGQSEAVKTLTDAELAELREGAGMGLARPAELNGYPGPRHVLELADSLALTPDQRERTTALFEAMRREAVALGEDVIAAEASLDAAFAGEADAAELARQVAVVAELRGRLRWTHLRTHLAMREILSTHQRHEYDRLRGYHSAGHDHGPDAR